MLVKTSMRDKFGPILSSFTSPKRYARLFLLHDTSSPKIVDCFQATSPLEASQRMTAVRKAYQRAVVVLREIDGLSYDEIADSLAVAVGTVKSRLARARQHLRAELGRR